MITRIFTALLGVWLFVSAFMWNHGSTEFTVTVVCGVLTFALAIASIYVGVARYMNAGLAVVLFLAALAIPATTHTTTWHNVIIAAAIFVASLASGTPDRVGRERELYGRV